MDAIGFRLYGMERGIDYSMIEKKTLRPLAVASADWFKKKIVRSFARAVLVKDAVQIHIRLTPAVRVAVEGGVCPGKRGGIERNEDGSAQGISYRD